MKILYNWLKEFLDFTAPPEELRARLSMAGIGIDAIEDSHAGPLLDADLTTNRPDCLGHYGIAREVAALYRLRLKRVAPQVKEATEKVERVTRVEIECPELCGRYTARLIRGVRVAPSPDWLRQLLEALGQASINNVVDATNYVMFELGHPTHAFDFNTLVERRILVRRAQAGEKMRTLDGLERVLEPEMCVIADGARAVAIGGVMGGAETEISFSSKNVLLEAAWFNPISIRRTSKTLGLRTEASTRFERGADPEMAELASRRCAELILQLAGGELLGGAVDVYPGKRAPKKMSITRAEILRVMGADVPDKEIESILGALGFAPVRVDQNRGQAGSILAAWECTQPSWRADVEREIDLIEEVARVYGLDKFPPRLPAARQGAARLPHYEAESRLRERLIGLGYREIVTIPHVAEDRDALFRPDGVLPARLANPLSEEMNLLRSNGSVSMAGAIEWNLNHGQRNVRLFEIGRYYRFASAENLGGGAIAPLETLFLTLGATGEARPQGLYDSARAFAFPDLKGDLDAIGTLAGGFQWTHGGAESLHPAKRGQVRLGENQLGSAGQLAGRVAA